MHARVTAHPTSEWLAQLIIETCGISREPPRYLIHHRDGCFGASFKRRFGSLDISEIRTPVKVPKANAIAERWVCTIRNEYLDHRVIMSHQHLWRLVVEFIAYYNRWPSYRSLGRIPPCPHIKESAVGSANHLVAEPVLGKLHHVCQ